MAGVARSITCVSQPSRTPCPSSWKLCISSNNLPAFNTLPYVTVLNPVNIGRFRVTPASQYCGARQIDLVENLS